MFEKGSYRCPRCGFDIAEPPRGGAFSCSVCSAGFRVMADEQTGKVAFYEEPGRVPPEPLYLPKGSIRALVALAMAVSCWALIFTGADLPASLLGLLLTLLGYYFAFRARVAAAASRIYDPSARQRDPLFLPGGAVRWLLILGFAASGLYLYARGGMKQVKYFEFFVILLGLVLGYVFGRISARGRGSSLYLLINHVKGIVVLAAAGLLTLLLVTGLHAKTSAHQLALCAVVSFYYGSRT